VESKTLETTPPPPSSTSRRRRTRWLQGPSSRSSTIGSRTLTTTILNTCTLIIIENKHAESKKISVKVQSRDESEELAVESRTLETPPSPSPRPVRTRLTRCASCKLRLRLRRSTSTPSPIQYIFKKAKNSHAEPKKIAVKVYGEKTRTEEIDA
jgi:hypothetical protein